MDQKASRVCAHDNDSEGGDGPRALIFDRDSLTDAFHSLSRSVSDAARKRPSANRVHLPARAGDHEFNPDWYPKKPLRGAAVLVPVVNRSAGLTVMFTRRTDHLHHHAGQISFPGGRVEEFDQGPADTALRETEEECGLDRDHVNVIGRLEDYVTRTGFRVTPVVGIVEPPFELAPDSFEVAEVFEVPLDFLLNPTNHVRAHRRIGDEIREFHAMPYEDYFIWGATAGMLRCLYGALSQVLGDDVIGPAEDRAAPGDDIAQPPLSARTALTL